MPLGSFASFSQRLLSALRTALSEIYAKQVLQDQDGALLNFPKFFYKIRQGYGFAASKRFEGVTSGDSVDILFRNPPDSGRNAVIVSIEIIGLAQLYADIYKNNTVTSDGTLIPAVNLNLASAITNKAVVAYGGSYSLGTMIYNMVVPGGSHIRAIGGAIQIGETVILPPGGNFILRVTNKSASATDFSARAVWWEEPT